MMLSGAVDLFVARTGRPNDRVVLIAEVGSSAYGLNLEETSDWDVTLVWLPNFVDLCSGIPEFRQIRTQPDGVRSGPGDYDINVYSLPKFTHLVCKGNPSILSALYASPSSYRIDAEELIAYLQTVGRTKAALSAFLGYAHQQAESIIARGGRGRISRPELIARHGYDTKFAAHAMRLTLQGIHYARTGDIPAPMPEPDRQTVLDVRRGLVSVETVQKQIGQLTADLRYARDTSTWPDHADAVDVWSTIAQYLRPRV